MVTEKLVKTELVKCVGCKAMVYIYETYTHVVFKLLKPGFVFKHSFKYVCKNIGDEIKVINFIKAVIVKTRENYENKLKSEREVKGDVILSVNTIININSEFISDCNKINIL
jgi:hypothetical protein